MRLLRYALLTSTSPIRGFDGEKLKFTYDKKEDIPAAFVSLFTEGDDEKWTFTGIDGIKTQVDVDKVQAALRKERADHKTTKDKIKALGNRSIDEVIEQLDRIPELEAQIEAADMDPKKIDALVEAKIKGRLAPVERERDGLKTKLGELETEIGGLKGDKRTRTIHDAIREAATKAKLLPEAMEDALILSDRIFDIAEDGKIIVKDDAVGHTPGLEAQAWFIDMQKKRPHWWAASNGGGAGGNRGGGNGLDNPWTNENWNMTAQGAIVLKDPALAANLAAAAGTKIGGLRPVKK